MIEPDAPTKPVPDGELMPVSASSDTTVDEQPHQIWTRGGFGFLLNVKGLQGASSIIFPDGHELRPAKPEEVTGIKQVLRGLMALNPMHEFMWEWERDARGQYQRLPENEHRYFILAFPDGNSELSDFQEAFDICHLELEIGPVLFYQGSYSWQASRLLHVIQEVNAVGAAYLEVSAGDVAEISALYNALKQYSSEATLNVRRAARQLGDLKGLPSMSDLKALGYFAVLESLLTHAPKPSDPYDSITRQIKTKLALLQNRWKPPLDYVPFGNVSTGKIWSTMYAYRSQIAHGGIADFGKDFSVLKDKGTANKLIREAAKSVVRFALAEPQFVADLRDC